VWIDYSGGTVSGASMRAAGIEGAIRYVGLGGSGKRLTHAEYADHLAHGRKTIAVVERTTTDADGGYATGRANAAIALTDLRNITAGQPPVTMVFAANDKPGFNQADIEYVKGFHDVLTPFRFTVGPYGFGAFLAACAKAGLAPIAWQAGPAPSRTGTADVATFWQRQGGPATAADGPATPVTRVIGGVTCDLSNRLFTLEPTVTSPINKLTAQQSAEIASAAHDLLVGNSTPGGNPQGRTNAEIFAFRGLLASAVSTLSTLIKQDIALDQSQQNALADLATKVAALQAALAAPDVEVSDAQVAAMADEVAKDMEVYLGNGFNVLVTPKGAS
jgi:hypothetical protein